MDLILLFLLILTLPSDAALMPSPLVRPYKMYGVPTHLDRASFLPVSVSQDTVAECLPRTPPAFLKYLFPISSFVPSGHRNESGVFGKLPAAVFEFLRFPPGANWFLL